jgi:hypothetical protein
VTKHSAYDPSSQSIAMRQPAFCYDITLLCANDDHGKYLTASRSDVGTSHEVAVYRCGARFSPLEGNNIDWRPNGYTDREEKNLQPTSCNQKHTSL